MSSRSELLTYLAQYSISIPPKNVKKTFGFLTFSGGTEWNTWVNHIPLTHFRSMVSFVVRCAIWVPFVQFKKHEKHPRRSVNFRKVTGFIQPATKINTPPWVFFTFFKLHKCYQIAQRTTFINLTSLALLYSYLIT